MQVVPNAPLWQYTSLKVGGPAAELVRLEGGDTLSDVIAERSGGSLWVLGYGTNCLISDQGLPGTVILNQAGEIQRLGSTRFKVDSGASWDEFVQVLIANDLWGLEFTSGIPGGVGAAVTGSIAAYGHKVADRLAEATLLDTRNQATEVWQTDRLGMSYRSSILQRPEHQYLVVLDATFELSPEPTGDLQYDSALRVSSELGLAPDTLANRRRIIMEARRRAGSLLIEGDPGQAGSFFKNPLAPAELIDHILSFEESDLGRQKLRHQTLVHGENQARVPAALVLFAAGFKRGQQWGNVRLHPHHVLKVENVGGATAQEIYDVVQEIITTVKDELGITLEPEVRFLGEF